MGCKRSIDEIRDWSKYTSKQRIEIMNRLGYGIRKGGRNSKAIYDKG